jgi:hypothetical protein
MAQALLTSLNSIPFPQHDLPTHKCFLFSLAFDYAGEYFWAVRVLAPFFFACMSFDTTSIFITLHPESNGYYSFFFKDYEPNHDIELFFNSFKLAFQHMPHLSTSGLCGVFFEHLWKCFHVEDLTNGFPQSFQLCFHIAHGHIPPQIACVLGVACFLTMTKHSSEVHPIIVGETLYQLISHILCL